MDVSNLIGGILGGALSSSAITAFVITTARERWMEGVKAQYATELENVKDSLQREQKSLQAKLDHGTYVTEAQYDLELSSYKDLWLVMSELRERWRSLFAQFDFQVQVGEAAFAAAIEQAGKDLGAAHDNAVLISERLAPFYEKSIHAEARATTLASHVFLLSIGQSGAAQAGPSSEDIKTKLDTIVLGVEKIDDLIRNRLSSLRLLQ